MTAIELSSIVKKGDTKRIFKNKWFSKFARTEGIGDEKLIQAVSEIDAGRIDADYGGGMVKQRIARSKEGKSGGYRTIILIRKGDKAVFVYGFAKSVLDNIDDADVRGFKKLRRHCSLLRRRNWSSYSRTVRSRK